MKLNYLGRYIFSRICSYLVEKHFPASQPRCCGRPHGGFTQAWKGRRVCASSLGRAGADPHPGRSLAGCHVHCGLEGTAVRQQASPGLDSGEVSPVDMCVAWSKQVKPQVHLAQE